MSVYLYTSLMGPWDLHLTAQEFILQHFEQVAVKSKDFCSLSRDQISRLISSDKLLVSSEGEVRTIVTISEIWELFFRTASYRIQWAAGGSKQFYKTANQFGFWI